MNFESWTLLFFVVGLIVYLVYALLKPEKF